jgi:hypothetical protein
VKLNSIDVTQFHTYTILAKPGLLEWQVDGATLMQAPAQGVPDLPLAWIINGWVGGWPGTPTDATPFPATFEVDYVRVYRVDGLLADPAIRIMNIHPAYEKSEKVEIAVANFDGVCAHIEMYDGDKLIRTTSTRPYKFDFKKLNSGPHQITFVATDGVRRATATLSAEIN